MAARARDYGLAGEGATAYAARNARALLDRFAASPLRAEMDGAGGRLHEVPYALLGEDGGLEGGVIDALYRREGRWTLVEFKSDYVPGREGARRLLDDGYRDQLRRYTNAVEATLGERPRVLLCLLNYRGSVRILREPELGL
jgi:ATP-dependent helicase/nuclease subunit A